MGIVSSREVISTAPPSSTTGASSIALLKVPARAGPAAKREGRRGRAVGSRPKVCSASRVKKSVIKSPSPGKTACEQGLKIKYLLLANHRREPGYALLVANASPGQKSPSRRTSQYQR